VNPDHFALIPKQREALGTKKGFICTNANCSTTGLAVVLKALDDAFGLDKVMVTTMQAVSGAGYPGLSSMDILDNVIPYISGEEDKLESESHKILGRVSTTGDHIDLNEFPISAHANRVCVIDGHTECASIQFKHTPAQGEALVAKVKEVLRAYEGPLGQYACPSKPTRPIIVTELPDRPQPRLDREAEGGMAVTVGRIRPCKLFDIKLVLLSHNTLLGAAGGALLNAEIAVAMGVAK